MRRPAPAPLVYLVYCIVAALLARSGRHSTRLGENHVVRLAVCVVAEVDEALFGQDDEREELRQRLQQLTEAGGRLPPDRAFGGSAGSAVNRGLRPTSPAWASSG
jgi:hypothetical protein